MLTIGLDARRLVYASNVALVAALSLAAAFLINLPDVYWALLTVPFVVQMEPPGNTVWRTVGRVTGTVLGGIVAVAVISVFAQQGLATIAALSLWAFAIGALSRFEFGLDAYAYAVAGLTTLIIVFDAGPAGDQGYSLALERVTEICIPAAAAFMIPLVLFPAPVRDRVRREIADAEKRVLSLARQAASSSKEAPATEWMEVVRALTPIYSDLRASRLESLLATPLDEDAVLANDLDRLLVATTALSLALKGLEDNSSLAIVAQSRRDLAQILSPATDEKDGKPDAGRLAELVARLEAPSLFRPRADAGEPETRHDLAALVAIHQVAVEAQSFCRDAKPNTDRSRATARKIVLGTRYRDWPAAFQRGARAAIVLFVLSLLRLWSASAQFEPLAELGAALALALPAIVPRAQLTAAGFGIGMGIAAMFLPALALEAVLPLVQGFAAYAALIGSVLFVLAYIASRQGRFAYAIGGVIFLAEALQPSDIETYSGINLMNTAVVLLFLPVIIAVTFNVIFPETTRWLRWRLNQGMTQLLRQASTDNEDEPSVLLRQSLDLVGDYGGDLDAKDPSNQACLRRCGAVRAAFTALQTLNRMQRRDELPAEIARTLPDVRQAVVDDAQGRGPAHTRSNLRTLADVLATAQAYIVENFDDSIVATLRFAGWVQFLRMLVEQRRLAPAE